MSSKSLIFLPFLHTHSCGKTVLIRFIVNSLIYHLCGLQSFKAKDIFYLCIIFLEGWWLYICYEDGGTLSVERDVVSLNVILLKFPPHLHFWHPQQFLINIVIGFQQNLILSYFPVPEKNKYAEWAHFRHFSNGLDQISSLDVLKNKKQRKRFDKLSHGLREGEGDIQERLMLAKSLKEPAVIYGAGRGKVLVGKFLAWRHSLDRSPELGKKETCSKQLWSRDFCQVR